MGLGRVGARVGVMALLAIDVGVKVRVVRKDAVGGAVVVSLGVSTTGCAVAMTVTVTTTVITRAVAVATGGSAVAVGAGLVVGSSVNTMGNVGSSAGGTVGAVVGNADVGNADVGNTVDTAVGAMAAVVGSGSAVGDSCVGEVTNSVTAMGWGVGVAPKGNAGVPQATSANTAHSPGTT